MRRPIAVLRDHPWVLAWLGLVVVTAIAVLADDWGVFAPDTKPELYLNPDGLLERSLHVWQPDPHLGQVNYNTGILPVAAVMTVLQFAGIAPWLLQRLVMITLLLVGAWGTARLVTALTDRTGAGPWLAGVVHAWHPWTIVGAATLPVRLPHAVLPWLLLATHRAITRGGWGRAAVAGLVYGAMAGINGGVVNLLYVLPVLVLVAWEVATRQATPLRAALRLGMIGVVAVGVSLYWLLPTLAAVGSSAGDVLLATEDPTVVGRLSPPSEVLRGMGMWTSYIVIDGLVENPEQIRFLTSPAVVMAGFLLSSVAVASLVGIRRRTAGLVLALAAVGTTLMIGINASGGQSPLGAGLARLFEVVPAATAFRTTNKAGSMLVLALALALGVAAAEGAWRRLAPMPRHVAIGGVLVLLVVAAGPLLPGQLHPLQVPVPDYWFAAADATDVEADDRLLFLPGNAQVRYLWGHRGVDDLDTALYDDRHVVWRSTIPVGSRPATNLLTAFDLGLELDALDAAGFDAHTQLLGAGTALVRTDTDWLRNFGRPTGDVLDDVLTYATPTAVFGPSAADRGLTADVVPPELPALTQVSLQPTSVAAAWRMADPLVVVGDAMAVDPLARAGFAPSDRPLLYLDQLDDDTLGAALAAGGHVVLTDTNHRRRWSVASLTDGYSPLLPADADVPAEDQRSRSTDPRHQTVSLNRGPFVHAAPDPSALLRPRAAGRPAFAYDGNFLTGWQYGARTEARDGWVELVADTPGRVDTVDVIVGQSFDKDITEVRVSTDERSSTVPVVNGVARAVVEETTRTVRVTITDTVGFSSTPASVLEILIDGDPEVWQPIQLAARLPRTLALRHDGSSPALQDGLAQAPLHLLLARLQGDPGDAFDDEETRLRREFALPWPVDFAPSALRGVVRLTEPATDFRCHVLGRVRDAAGTLHEVRGRATRLPAAGEPVEVVGCGPPVIVPAGDLTFVADDFVTVDHLWMGSAPPPPDARRAPVEVRWQSPSSGVIELEPSDESVLVSSGQAWHPGWRAVADGRLLGEPLVVGGHAAGWLLPAGTARVDVVFEPRSMTRIGQWLSLAVAALAVLTAIAGARRWRR